MRRLVALALTLLAAHAAPAAADLVPIADPVQLNASPPCYQHSPSVAVRAGGFVTAWAAAMGEGADGGVGGRLLDADGQPVGEELRFDSAAGLYLGDAAVVAGAGGGFVVGWWGYQAASPALVEIRLRAFAADGQPLGPEIDPVTAGGEALPSFALASDGLGRPTVAWSDGATIWAARFDAALAPLGTPIAVAAPAPDDGVGRLAVAAQPDGELLVVWEENGPTDPGHPPSPYTTVRGRRIGADGAPIGSTFTVDQAPVKSEASLGPAAAALAGGGFVVAWTNAFVPGVLPGVFAQLLDAAGSLQGDTIKVNGTAEIAQGDVALLADPEGGFLAAWWSIDQVAPVDPPPVNPYRRSYLRAFAADGSPLSEKIEIGHPPDPAHFDSEPALARSGDLVEAVWRNHHEFPPVLPPPCAEDTKIFAREFVPGCTPSETRLCLQGGRFAVEVRLPGVGEGSPDDPRAGTVPLTDDAGTFSFFRPENVELMVKVLDGRPLNGHFWVFYGALSNVHYAIDVLDTRTGTSRTYNNPLGHIASRADTGAFSDATPAGLGVRLPSPVAATGSSIPGSADGACTDPDVLCLHGGQFQVRLAWHDPRSGNSGAGTGLNLSDESGYFWFFRPGNAELVVKVLDAVPVNDYYWVFFGGLTDVQYTLTVEDVVNHNTYTYDNPPYALTSHADTAALPGPTTP
jgi:hypothetical protein